jgi:Cu(I)/Ag(I) efflux system membrane fusion protein
MYVDPATELYTISDLSRLWLLADLYDRDAPFVRVGATARISVAGERAPRTAKVTFLAPTIDQTTRTLQARFELDNKDGSLRPGAFASVELELALGAGLAVPETAVIRTGTRAIVFVVHGEHIEPREVTLGPQSGSFYRVDAGLVAGERVATGAQFLLDSESRLRATSGAGAGHAH